MSPITFYSTLWFVLLPSSALRRNRKKTLLNKTCCPKEDFCRLAVMLTVVSTSLWTIMFQYWNFFSPFVCMVILTMYYFCQSFPCCAKIFVVPINLQCACLLWYNMCIISSLSTSVRGF